MVRIGPEREPGRDPARDADAGISLAVAGASDSGSVLLPGTGSRREQLLPPVHYVWLEATHIRPSLAAALGQLSRPLPQALGLHSGPSKSADIGQTLVTGVHGPGRLIVVLFETTRPEG